MREIITQRGTVAVAASLVLALGASACGGSSSGGTARATGAESSSLPSSVELYGMTELSGPGANVGNAIKNGYELGAEQINASGLLGSTKLTVKIDDDQTSATTGASLASQAARKNYPVVFGPAFSSE